ncbi:MAG: guanylate kinase [Tissierellia bacterium]|nr:guanylate kinase [Tissierellia bacterium]
MIEDVSKGFLLVVSGPSGSGKGTVCNELMKAHKDVVFSISATTRAIRDGEVDGIHYQFLSEEDFLDKVEKGLFLEYANVHNNYYGTPYLPIKENIDKGNIALLEIDVQGAMQVKENNIRGVYVFIAPPSMEELESRLIKRGTDSPEVIARRMKNAIMEMDYISKYDYLIVNDSVEESVRALESILFAEKHRVIGG